MSFMSTMRSFFRRSAPEGEPRPGPYYLPKTGAWLPDGAPVNWWQTGYSPESASRSAIVQACISAYAQTVSMCPGDHWRATEKGGRERVTASAVSRILRRPNDYQSGADFLQNLVWELYATGNAYCLALRNDRYEVDELHLMKASMCQPMLGPEGDVFYKVAGNDVISRRLGGKANFELMIPARDILHCRLNARSGAPWPLVGESPLASIGAELMTQGAINGSQANFYLNQARPSAVLSTDLVLDKDQVQALRDRWDDQSRGLKAGGTPILTAGLKVLPWTTSARDSQTAELFKLSDERIALAFRIPMQILGIGGGSPAGSTEVLMQSWVSSGLGYALSIVEESFGQFFRLKGQPDEYVEFSTEALLRSQFKDRIDALVKGVQGGVFSPNDARNMESLDSVPFGDDVRVQAQNVPLSAAGSIPTAPTPPAAPAAPVQPSKIYPNAVKDAALDLRRRLRDQRLH
jgi:HK97 family phage portal protein